jgi:hypothetical protein
MIKKLLITESIEPHIIMAGRQPSEETVPGDKSRSAELEKQGWTMRFVAGEPRLSEAVELYEASGFEVLLESLPKNIPCNGCAGEETERQCSVCFDGHEDQYKMIFTRPCLSGKKEDEDIF